MRVAARKDKKEREELPEMDVTGEDLAKIDSILNEYGRKRSSVLDILHELQNKYHYLPKELLEMVSRELDMPYTQVFGLGTFFDAFFMKPLGKYRLDTCMGTTCYNEGSAGIMEALEDYIGIEAGETRDDGLFTLLGVHCIGCCSIAPAMRVGGNEDERVHGYLTPEKAVDVVKEIEEREEEFEITEEIIQETLDYIKDRGGKIEPSEAAEDLGLKEDQFNEVVREMKDRGVVKQR